MKKILSLLSMLMITVMAFATDYKGQLDCAIKINSNSFPASIAEGTLSITQYANGNYQVTAKDCNIPDVANLGNIECDGLSGTTDANGVTTIDVTDCTAGLDDGSSWTDLSSTKLLVKFNNEKAYATFEGKYWVGVWRTVSYTFGTDDFESTGGGTVTEKYTVNFDKGAKSTHSDRVLNSFSLQQTGKEKQTESVSALRAAYEDHTSKVFTVEAGSELTASFNYSGEWMNGYVYIDRDNDGEFSYKEGQWDQAGTDLVAYSFYTTLPNPKVNDGNGYNSTGASVSGNDRSNVNPPSFTAPTEPGTYRIRFKIDWNCILPGGSNDILSDGGGVWDATLNVVAAEPEVTVTFEKQYADQLYSLADGTPSAMGDATVTLKEMSDNTISMSLAFIDMNVESTDLVKGTDEKDRITYTGTTNFQGINYAVKALRYTKDEEEKLYMTLIPTDGTTLAFGTDPDYVAPEPPSIEGTVVEGSVDFAANGSKFEWSNIAIDWNKQKLVAVIDLSTCVGTNEDILSVGQNISAWQIGGWHFYYTKSDNRMKSDYLTTGGAHPISDANTPVEPGIVRIELSKAEGCTIDGVSFNGFYDSSVTGTWQSNTEDFWNLTSVNIGSKEGNGRSNAVIKYVTVVDIESTGPETPKAVVYKNTLKIVRGTDTKEYTDAEVSVLAKGEGKYEVVLPEFSDMDSAEGTIPGTIGKLTFVADGVEADGKLKLTASSVETTQEGGEGWESQTFTASMDATVENDQLAGTFTVVVDGYETMYTYNLYYGVEAPEVVTEVSNDNYTSNLRILDGETTVVEEAEANVNIVKYSDESYKVTLKDVTLNENTQDLVFVGKALIEEAPTEATEPLTIIAKSDEATTAFFGEEMNGTFEITEVSDDEIKMEFAIEGEGVLYEGEFNYEAKTPAAEPFCKENYVADGNGFEWEILVDWDTQKIVMSIDPSTCTGNCEDVIGLGAVPTAWVNTLHLYRTRADKMLQGYFQVPGGSNNNTDKFAETVPFLVEVSKAQGFVVNDVVKIPASAMSYLFTLPTVKMGTGEGANDKSRATYNYVKVVDKDWTKDPETGINATTVAEGEFEVFSVDGVKLAKLQKGLNIVRSADGKVKKVLVK